MELHGLRRTGPKIIVEIVIAVPHCTVEGGVLRRGQNTCAGFRGTSKLVAACSALSICPWGCVDALDGGREDLGM